MYDCCVRENSYVQEVFCEAYDAVENKNISKLEEKIRELITLGLPPRGNIPLDGLFTYLWMLKDEEGYENDIINQEEEELRKYNQ